MAPTPPKVSVIMASYNHGRYVRDALQSVLDQSFQNFEIIVTDDGSSDDSVEIIKSIDDPRIKLYCFESNQGACAATNYCIRHATGKYVAVMNSDDLWCKEKLKNQFEFLEQQTDVGAVFSNALFVREDGSDFPAEGRPDFFDVFSQENRSPASWLRNLFYGGNCLCHPSILIRRSCYDSLGLYNNSYRQLPDFDMWIRFCKGFRLHVMPEKLVRFRLLPAGMNASSQVGKNAIRTINEHYLIAKHYFDDVSAELYKEAFADDLINPGFDSEEQFECEKALLFLGAETHLSRVYRWVALEKLFELLNHPRTAGVLRKDYHFDDKSFIDFSSTLDFLIERPNPALPETAQAERSFPMEEKSEHPPDIGMLSSELLLDELALRIKRAPIKKVVRMAGKKMWGALGGRR